MGGLRQQWQADLVDLSNWKNYNDGMTFLLTVIDVFSKVAWCIHLKNKSAASLVTALKSTFTNGWPKTLQTYQRLEFLNKSVQALLKKYGIHHFTTPNSETKASIAERFNKTLKTRMWRYFTKHQTWRYVDVLQDFVQSYNDTPPPIAASAWLRHRYVQRIKKRCGSACTVTTIRVCSSSVCQIACASVSTMVSSTKATWRIGTKRCSRYTRFIPPIRPCND